MGKASTSLLLLLTMALAKTRGIARELYFSSSTRGYDSIVHKHRKHKRGRPK
jgi:hypothetical protein